MLQHIICPIKVVIIIQATKFCNKPVCDWISSYLEINNWNLAFKTWSNVLLLSWDDFFHKTTFHTCKCSIILNKLFLNLFGKYRWI